jgi:hypothetical protein
LLKVSTAPDADEVDAFFTSSAHNQFERGREAHDEGARVRRRGFASEGVTQPPRFHFTNPAANALSETPKGREKYTK